MKRITYKSSGVDIDKANAFLKAVGPSIKSSLTKDVIRRPGAFGGLFALDHQQYKNPVLVSSTDGVGTKLLIAQQLNHHSTVGIDLVAMNVNDILCCGAKPLFFLDYIACGKVNVNVLKDVVKGIVAGCRQAGCSLIGGETAEMPGMYAPQEYDLAGFVVGVVDKDKIIDGSRIKAEDCVIGLPSSGLHSNGYSLARKVLGRRGVKQWGKVLLTPTRIYTREVLGLLEKFEIKGLAHLTGGAYYEKLTKILPAGKCFVLNRRSWPVPKIFQMLQKKGKISLPEMYRTFNMGIGMAIVVSGKNLPHVMAYLKQRKIKHYLIGKVVKDSEKKIVFST
jgi:phosphoribosylformylglycinamidine cyclo-ligase